MGMLGRIETVGSDNLCDGLRTYSNRVLRMGSFSILVNRSANRAELTVRGVRKEVFPNFSAGIAKLLPKPKGIVFKLHRNLMLETRKRSIQDLSTLRRINRTGLPQLTIGGPEEAAA